MFDSHFSLHEPLIETASQPITNKREELKTKKKVVIKSENKKISSVRKKKKPTSVKIKKNVEKKEAELEVESKQITQDQVSNENEEKTGWWS